MVAPTTPGYGTSVICDLIPYELGGAVDLTFAAKGVGCRIVIPAKCIGSKGFRTARRGLASSCCSACTPRRYLDREGCALGLRWRGRPAIGDTLRLHVAGEPAKAAGRGQAEVGAMWRVQTESLAQLAVG